MPSFNVIGTDRASGHRVAVTLDGATEADVRRNPVAAALDGVEVHNAAAASVPTMLRDTVWPKVRAYLIPSDKGDGVRHSIRTNARQVRTGASIIGAISLLVMLIGLIVTLVGVHNFVFVAVDNDSLLSPSPEQQRAAAITVLMSGFAGILAGLVLRAGAAFMRMISFTCDMLSETQDKPALGK